MLVLWLTSVVLSPFSVTADDVCGEPTPSGSGGMLDVMVVPVRCSTFKSFVLRNPGVNFSYIPPEKLASYSSQVLAFGRRVDPDWWASEIVLERTSFFDVIPLFETGLIHRTLNSLPVLSAPKSDIVVTNSKGEVVAVPDTAHQTAFFYRRDLFDAAAVEWAETWDAFETGCRRVQQSHPGVRCVAAGTVDDTELFNTLLMMVSGETELRIAKEGKVVVNNPAMHSAFARLRGWNGTIMSPTPMAGEDALAEFVAGKAAVLVGTTAMESSLRSAPGTVEMVPVPGGGFSVQLLDMVAVSPTAKDMGLAQDYIAAYIEAAAEASVAAGGRPMGPRGIDDPTFCSAWPLVCGCARKHPGYWRRIMQPPVRECGAMYGSCKELAAARLRNVLQGELDVSDALTDLEHSFRQMLNLEQAVVLAPGVEFEEWGPTRFAMIAVAVVCGAIIIALVAATYLRLHRMGGKGAKPPMPILFGGLVGIVMAVVLAVLIVEYNGAVRGVSNIMEDQLQTIAVRRGQTLITNVLSLHWDFRPAEEVRSRTIMSVYEDLKEMRIPRGSLFTVVDRRNKEVVVTSDEVLQPRGTDIVGLLRDGLNTVSKEGREWDTAFLAAHETYAFGGYRLQLGSVNFPSPHPPSRVSFDWLVVYIVSDRYVYDSADEIRAQSVDLAIIVSLVSVCVVMAATFIILSPVERLASTMADVCMMRTDHLSSTLGTSAVREMSILLEGFDYMSQMMKEYKTFLPNSVLEPVYDDDDEDDETEGQKSVQPAASASSKLSSKSTHSKLSAVHTAAVLQRGMNNISSMTVLVVRYHDFVSSAEDTKVNFARYLETVESVKGVQKAVLHHFSAVSPGEVVLSWGAVGSTAQGPTKACSTALHLADLLGKAGGRHSMCVTHGKGQAGNIGTASTRSFGMLGPAVEGLDAMLDLSLTLSCETGKLICTATRAVAEKVTGKFDLPPVELVQLPSMKTPTQLRYIRKAVAAEGDDWIYGESGLEGKDLLSAAFRKGPDGIEAMIAVLEEEDASQLDPVAKAVLARLKAHPKVHGAYVTSFAYELVQVPA